MIREAIDHYHNLLEREYLSSTHELLSAHNERLSVAGRPACSVLRPHLIDQRTYAFVREASSQVMCGIRTLGQRLIHDAQLRSHLDLSEEEEEAVRIDCGYGAPDVSARLDGFVNAQGKFRFVEYNADSPGGLGYGDALSDVFTAMPLLNEFRKRYDFYTFPVRSLAFDALLGAYHRWGGAGLPNIAIVDWRGAATYNEFLLFLDYFERRGCKGKIVDPDELEYRNGQLVIADFHVHLLYKRVVVGEFLQKFKLRHPVLQAVRDHAVCMANGFGVQMLFKKSMFAFLSNPEFAHIFAPEVAAALSRHIPWTRKVRECKTTYHDSSVDLVPWILQNREQLVIKPNGEYGGKGVVLGWECDDSRWLAVVQEALSGSFVVQERVSVGREVYPSVIDGRLRFDERYFDLDPYVWDGERVEGCGVRLSRQALLNVSAGGGSATPMFVLRTSG